MIMSKKTSCSTYIVLALSVFLLVSGTGRSDADDAKKKEEKSESKDVGKEAERALSAANVILEISKTPESSIPQDLLNHADAIAVIPNVVKAAFGVGGRHGKGIVAHRLHDGSWGAPGFIEVSGGSFGLQIGVSVTDVILVFTNDDGLKGLFEDKLELGGDAGVAAGPVGRSAEAGTNLTFDSPIYSYSRSKGLFAGLALKGTVMTLDNSANRRLYGEKVTGREILLGSGLQPAGETKPFLEALNRVAPKTTHQKKPMKTSSR
jgi:lipid-binding SYLF domain-containing protein